MKRTAVHKHSAKILKDIDDIFKKDPNTLLIVEENVYRLLKKKSILYRDDIHKYDKNAGDNVECLVKTWEDLSLAEDDPVNVLGITKLTDNLYMVVYYWNQRSKILKKRGCRPLKKETSRIVILK